MKIGLNLIGNNYKSYFKKQYPNLKPLSKDTVSFQSMKKNQFFGIDLMMINKLKAPIENFNSNDDFQNWCKNILEKDYLNKTDELSESYDMQAQEQKKKILSDWINYVTVENNAYTPAIQLLILSSITSTLDKSTNHLPPNLDKRILADTIYEITQNSKNDKNYNCNFDKLYRNKLFTGAIQEETNIDPTLSGWIIIPSQTNDPDNFDDNVKKLQILSHDTWCTKTYNAEPYLAEGDFHIYLEHGKPKLGVRFVGDEIQEVQGEKNNSKIPVKYFDELTKHVEENGYKFSQDGEYEYNHSKAAKEKLDKFEQELKAKGLEFKTCPTKNLFDFMDIKYKEDKDGKLILDSYSPDEYAYSFEDFGINENRLFKDIVKIKSSVDFSKTKVTNLGSLKSIIGDALFNHSSVVNLGDLKMITGNAEFQNAQFTTLNNLEYIGGNANFSYSNIKDLGKLKTIEGSADFINSDITSLNKLEYIGGSAFMDGSDVVDLGNLRMVKYDVLLNDKITDLKNLETIESADSLDFDHVTNLGKLNYVSTVHGLRIKSVNDLKNLEIVIGDLYIDDINMLPKSKLKKVDGRIFAKKQNICITNECLKYIQIAQKLFKKPLKYRTIKAITDNKLTERQIKIFARYRKEGIDTEEAAYLASFQ